MAALTVLFPLLSKSDFIEKEKKLNLVCLLIFIWFKILIFFIAVLLSVGPAMFCHFILL